MKNIGISKGMVLNLLSLDNYISFADISVGSRAGILAGVKFEILGKFSCKVL